MSKEEVSSKVSIEIPKTIEVDDYHEFKYIQSIFDELEFGLFCEEVGFSNLECRYIGIVFKEKDEKYHSMVRSIKEEMDI